VALSREDKEQEARVPNEVAQIQKGQPAMIELLTRNAGLQKLFIAADLGAAVVQLARDPEVGPSSRCRWNTEACRTSWKSARTWWIGFIDLRGPSENENFNAAKSAVVLDFSDIHKTWRAHLSDRRAEYQPADGNAAGAGDTGADPAAIRAAHAP